jgi:hypothetical protein
MTPLLDTTMKASTESPPAGIVRDLKWSTPSPRLSAQDIRDAAEADRRMNDPEQVPVDFEDAVQRMGK